MRTASGCWTCRLRRKKCDENSPVCNACATLDITCYFGQRRPEWMDGGVRQDEMAEQVKREVKEKTQRRLGRPLVRDSDGDIPLSNAPVQVPTPRSQESSIDSSELTSDRRGGPAGTDSTPSRREWADQLYLVQCESGSGSAGEPFGHSNSILFMFYLEELLPLLYPFYRPSPTKGGKAWILEMMMSSGVVRQVALCHSSYFFSLARGNADHSTIWESVLNGSREAFEIMSEALRSLENSDLTERVHCAVRLMTSVMKLQRFDIVVSNFHNCQTHLDAALALFQQLLSISDLSSEPRSTFNSLLARLGPTHPSPCTLIPSAEQAAFRFTSVLLILDDIIASIVLQQPPRLYGYHQALLSDSDDGRPLIDLAAVIGCQNKTLIHLGEISALGAWKQQRKAAGDLNVMDLARTAMPIEDSLVAYLKHLESSTSSTPEKRGNILDVLNQNSHQPPSDQSIIATRIWTHAALLYLFVVVSGWQPASSDVRYHVGQIIDLSMHHLSTTRLLRTVVWPFCVAGCLAEPAQHHHFREMVQILQPPAAFGTLYKALEIMEDVWADVGAANDRDLASCFRGQDGLVLLV